jgi:hypothetical protein
MALAGWASSSSLAPQTSASVKNGKGPSPSTARQWVSVNPGLTLNRLACACACCLHAGGERPAGWHRAAQAGHPERVACADETAHETPDLPDALCAGQASEDAWFSPDEDTRRWAQLTCQGCPEGCRAWCGHWPTMSGTGSGEG